MNINTNNWFVKIVSNHVKHYNHEAYWKMRAEVINPASKKPKWLRLFYLLRIKRMDAFANASMGTDLGAGAEFKTPPYFPHGMNGIVIGHYCSIGANCKILHQVTVQDGCSIGNNCLLGTGCKIINKARVGNNCKIGANAVVVKDVPDNHTAVGVPAKNIPAKRGV